MRSPNPSAARSSAACSDSSRRRGGSWKPPVSPVWTSPRARWRRRSGPRYRASRKTSRCWRARHACCSHWVAPAGRTARRRHVSDSCTCCIRKSSTTASRPPSGATCTAASVRSSPRVGRRSLARSRPFWPCTSSVLPTTHRRRSTGGWRAMPRRGGMRMKSRSSTTRSPSRCSKPCRRVASAMARSWSCESRSVCR